MRFLVMIGNNTYVLYTAGGEEIKEHFFKKFRSDLKYSS